MPIFPFTYYIQSNTEPIVNSVTCPLTAYICETIDQCCDRPGFPSPHYNSSYNSCKDYSCICLPIAIPWDIASFPFRWPYHYYHTDETSFKDSYVCLYPCSIVFDISTCPLRYFYFIMCSFICKGKK